MQVAGIITKLTSVLNKRANQQNFIIAELEDILTGESISLYCFDYSANNYNVGEFVIAEYKPVIKNGKKYNRLNYFYRPEPLQITGVIKNTNNTRGSYEGIAFTLKEHKGETVSYCYAPLVMKNSKFLNKNESVQLEVIPLIRKSRLKTHKEYKVVTMWQV